jgi:hypothetical protein
MTIEIDELLGAFDERDYSVRLVHTVCRVVPFAPDLPDWFSLVDGLKELDPEAKKPVLDRARELIRSDEAQRALWMVRSLDTADAGIGVFSGVTSAIALYKAKTGGERLDALETDTQQGVDAVLKGLAMAFVIYKLFPGSMAEKVAAFRNTTTGQAFVFYFAAIEVGLPFADNALLGGGSFVKSLFDRFGADQQAKLGAVAGAEEAAAAMSTVQQLVGPIETMAGMAREHLGGIAQAASGFLASALNIGDKVAGVAATGADMLQVYRFLGARLVAEACLRRALAEAKAEQEQKVATSAAAVPIKYTRSADDLPDSPKRGGGCALFGAVLLAATLAASAAAWAAVGG